jgi:hypothetical protein
MPQVYANGSVLGTPVIARENRCTLNAFIAPFGAYECGVFLNRERAPDMIRRMLFVDADQSRAAEVR